MKPIHEQVWKRDLDRAGVVHVTPDITLVCKVDISRLLGDEAATLREVDVLMGAVVALPDMAQALLEIREALASGTLDRDGAQEVAERVLRKAGVL